MISLRELKSLVKTIPPMQRWIRNRGAKNLERMYAKISDWYQAIAEREGLDYSEERTQQDVLGRPAIRGKEKKAWGKMHTFLIDDNGDYTRTHMYPALSRAGRCTIVDWKAIADVVPLETQHWRGSDPKTIKRLIEQVENANTLQPVDLIFCSCTIGTLGNEAVDNLAKLEIPMVSYWADDKQNFWEHMGGTPGNCPQVRFFDLCWTTSAACVPWYAVEGGRAIAMPEGADPGTFYVDISDDFRHEVSFVGMKYGIRPEYIDYLNRRGIPVQAFGRGWGKSELGWREMASIFARSRINLSFPWVGHSQRIATLKGRDFEAPMAGGLYLTGFLEELARHYRINEEIVCYNSIEECVDVIRHLLARPDLCQRIRKSGQQRALSDHTWDARFMKLMSFMGLVEAA